MKGKGFCKNDVDFYTLYSRALEIAKPFVASDKLIAGEVGCALSTVEGEIYTGVSINTPCSLGFCAEHSAIASLVITRQSYIDQIVSVDSNGIVMPSCGRCRQLLLFLNKKNINTKVYINNLGDYELLADLIPYFKGAKE